MLDMTFVLNESKAGKGAQDFLQNSLKENEELFLKEVNELKMKESDLLTQKSALNKEEYKKKIRWSEKKSNRGSSAKKNISWKYY